MAADWDLFIDETKKGGKLKYLGLLALEAGVTEGIFAQLAEAKHSYVSRGCTVHEVHWKNLGETEAKVAEEWLSYFFGGPMMFFIAAMCKPKETKESAVRRVLEALEADDRVPYGLMRGKTTIHLDADPSDPRDMLRRLRRQFGLLRAFSWESKGSLLLQLCDVLLGVALADESGSLDVPAASLSTRGKLKQCLVRHARQSSQERARRGKQNGVVLFDCDGNPRFLLLPKERSVG